MSYVAYPGMWRLWRGKPSKEVLVGILIVVIGLLVLLILAGSEL